MMSSEPAADRSDSRRPRVLIVDDNEDILAVTRRILRRHDYDTLTAKDGKSGLELARRDRPDLVLLDVMMPGIDGLEVCRQLKGDRETRKIMIILVTGRGSTDNLVEGLEAGADDYITKPFQLPELMARVRSALRVKQLTDEIEERNRELLRSQRERMRSEKMATIGLLATGIAHEFNNIMSGISGFAQLAETNPAFKDRLVELAKSQSERALQITRSLATYYNSNVEVGPTPLVPEIENALCLVTKRLKQKDINVVREYRDEPEVLAQAGQLQEVFLNLILNACQAVDVRGTITLRIEIDGDRAVARVQDDGCGVSEETLQRIFDPFFTTKGALGGGSDAGSGLGLTVSYNIVNSYGGRLTVTSEEKKGSTFTVELPLATTAAAASAEEGGAVIEGPASVLIGDPDENVREMVRGYLTRCELVAATSWKDVTAAIQRRPFDVAILDTSLPGEDRFINHLEKLLAVRPDLRVILTTSTHSSIDFREAKSRTDLHLLKPYSIENLSCILCVGA